jgi:hypothetical protein
MLKSYLPCTKAQILYLHFVLNLYQYKKLLLKFFMGTAHIVNDEMFQ